MNIHELYIIMRISVKICLGLKSRNQHTTEANY